MHKHKDTALLPIRVGGVAVLQHVHNMHVSCDAAAYLPQRPACHDADMTGSPRPDLAREGAQPHRDRHANEQPPYPAPKADGAEPCLELIAQRYDLLAAGSDVEG